MTLHNVIHHQIYDGAWRLFAVEPELKRSVWMLVEDGQIHLRCDYDVTQRLEENQTQYNAADNHWQGEYLHHVASIPANLFYAEIDPMHGDDKAIRKWLNNSDHRKFRTKPGNL